MEEKRKGLYERLLEDIHVQDGLNACINCGTCTAICPAAMFYKYDPRQIVDTVQSRDDKKIEELLKSETIWACGDLSCKPDALEIIFPEYNNSFKKSFYETGYFVSEKGSPNAEYSPDDRR